MYETPDIGLVTNWNYHDYGGMLQAYATQFALENSGYTIEVVNSVPLQTIVNMRKMKYFFRNLFNYSIVKEKSAILTTAMRKRVDEAFGAAMARRNNAFSSFCERSFSLSKEYSDWNDLSARCEAYQCVLVGSDQLWLPSNIYGGYYTLSFVPDGVRKVAYATSFGVSTLPKYVHNRTRAFLSRFDCLSAREESGQEIIREITGREVPLVCDPTLLLRASDWKAIKSDGFEIADPYIFCYLMGDNPNQRLAINLIRQETGWPIVSFPHLDRYIKNDVGFADVEVYDADPTLFLALIDNAQLVCTDSFHGTVFSAQFERPVLIFPRFLGNETLSTNSRIDTLLKKLGLQDRRVSCIDDVQRAFAKDIDYRAITKRIEAFRSESEIYLRNAIEG